MRKLVIIGGGPAGIAAAAEAGRLGAQVTIIEGEHLGGRAVWHSLLPSKVWLAAADRLGSYGHDALLGLHPAVQRIDFGALTARIAALSATTRDRHRAELDGLDVRVQHGAASLVDAHRVRVKDGDGERVLEADAVILATGSGPRLLPQVKPDGKRILAPRLMSHQTAIPGSTIVLGAGVTGAEYAYLFSQLGAAVTWVTDLPEILPVSDSDISGHLASTLAGRGVTILTDSPVESAIADESGVTVTLRDGRTLRAEGAFIALGRIPHTAGLNLEAAGLAVGPAGIAVDGFGQTAVPGLYAVGDVTGPPMTANKGMAQGLIAARHALGAPVAPYRAEAVVEAIYTEPQIAQVGLTEKAAAAAGQTVIAVRRDYAANLKAHLTGETGGFVKLVIDPATGNVRGAAAVGSHAADVIAVVAALLPRSPTLDDLKPVFAGHPTLSELVFDLARWARPEDTL